MTMRERLPIHQRATLSIPAVALVLDVSERTARTLVADGTLPSLTIGRRRLVSRAALERWVEERSRTGTLRPVPPTDDAA